MLSGGLEVARESDGARGELSLGAGLLDSRGLAESGGQPAGQRPDVGMRDQTEGVTGLEQPEDLRIPRDALELGIVPQSLDAWPQLVEHNAHLVSEAVGA